MTLFFNIIFILRAGKSWGYLTFCAGLFAILSLSYYIKSKADDDKLSVKCKEIEVDNDFIIFRKIKYGNITHEKRFAIDKVRGFREIGSRIMIKLGFIREKQVLDFEYEAEDIEALKTKLQALSNK